jgi:hypothetical protein
VSLPAIEKKKKYKRLAPHGSPSNRRWLLRTKYFKNIITNI